LAYSLFQIFASLRRHASHDEQNATLNCDEEGSEMELLPAKFIFEGKALNRSWLITVYTSALTKQSDVAFGVH
jgi:hypothetical protein